MTPPTPRRRRVVVNGDVPTPVPWGEDERLARPPLPVTAPAPAPARPQRRSPGDAPRGGRSPRASRSVTATISTRRRIGRLRLQMPRSRGLRTAMVLLVVLIVLAATTLVITLVLLGRRAA